MIAVIALHIEQHDDKEIQHQNGACIHDDLDCRQKFRIALRQRPDVILVGEVRDREVMEQALTAAETGHLVFGTLHTTGAAKTIDRIVNAFPMNQQETIRIQLSTVLQAVISQLLIPRGHRVVAIVVRGSGVGERQADRLGETVDPHEPLGVRHHGHHVVEPVRALGADVLFMMDSVTEKEIILTVTAPGFTGDQAWVAAKAKNPELVDDLKVHKPYIDAITYDSPFAKGARMERVSEVIDYHEGPVSEQLSAPVTLEFFPSDDLSAEVILAQVRSIIADLLALCGMDPLEATDVIPLRKKPTSRSSMGSPFWSTAV